MSIDGKFKQPITEEQGIHKEWYEVKPTLEELPKFLQHLVYDYQHDYGTICHAIAAGALATIHAMSRAGSGGITLFQAGLIMWVIIRKLSLFKGPLKIIDYDEMLYPQHEEDFDKTIKPHVWEYLQTEAKKKLEQYPDSACRTHWESIINGIAPFGYRVIAEEE